MPLQAQSRASRASLRRIGRFGLARGALAGPLGVLLVALIGAVFVLQGWRSRIPNFDMMTTIDDAQRLVDAGRLPDRGVLTSFFSFTPPGAAWLMAPGVWGFDDPRRFEYVGSLGTYVATLLGIFLLARMYFGRECALLATILYGFSEHGILAGTTLWQRYPIHCFTVWTVVLLARWVRDDKGRFLAGAIAVWSAGMYVFLEMAPAILLVPVLWVLFRPRVQMIPLAAALLFTFIIWFPYLRFERSRHFADVKSQVLRERI